MESIYSSATQSESETEKSSTALEREIVTHWCPLNPRLFAPRFRQDVGTLVAHGKAGVCARISIKRLGDDYVVWDKAAEIEFKKPGKDDLYATFEVSDDEIAAIESALETDDALDREYAVDLVDDDGVVHATVAKTLHVTTDDSKRA